jgi:CHAD domain-containing protein
VTPDGFELLLPDGADPAAVRDAIAGRLTVADAGAGTTTRTFLDTFDGRLYRRGLVLVHEDGRLALTNASDRTEVAGSEWAPAPHRPVVMGDGRPGRAAVDALPPGPLRDALEPVVGVRALVPVAATRVRAHRLRVLDDEGKTVVRLVVEAPSLVPGPAPLPPRVAVSPVRGYDSALRAARRALEAELGLVPASATLYEESVRALGGEPGGVPAKPKISLERGAPAARAAAAVLTALGRTIEANLPGAIDDVDPEFLHDLRIAVRRVRTVQRQLAALFEERSLARAREEMKRLQLVTGPVRDLDVQLLGFGALAARLPGERAAELVPLRALLADRRSFEHARMVRALRSVRTRRALDDWGALLATLAAAEDGPTAEALTGERIARVYRRMVRMGRAIGDDSPPEALHDLRKRGKELRYLLELFGSLFPREATKPLVTRLKGLQDTLGGFQDAQVQRALLVELREPLAARPGGPAALMAMGLVEQELAADAAGARAEFAERFAGFAAKEERRTVKEAFR